MHQSSLERCVAIRWQTQLHKVHIQSRIGKNKLESTETNQTGLRSSEHGEILPQTGEQAEGVSEPFPVEILTRTVHRKSKCHA